MGLGGGWAIGVYLGAWVIAIVVLALIAYLVIRKGVAHGIRDAQRLAARDGLPPRSET